MLAIKRPATIRRTLREGYTLAERNGPAILMCLSREEDSYAMFTGRELVKFDSWVKLQEYLKADNKTWDRSLYE